MLKTIVILFLITMIPGLELRASIPMGVLGGKWIDSPLAWPTVVLICVVSNILIGWGVFFLLDPIKRLLCNIPYIGTFIEKYLERAQRKLKPSVDKYGFWGLAFFIGIPLPLTGAYTGAAGAYALGMERKRFMIANVAGVLIAAICVTIITILIQNGCESSFFKFLIKSE